MLVLVAAPLILEAQPKKVYRLGHLSSLSPAGGERVVGAFKQGLRDLGYVEGQNIVIEHRWADGNYERLPTLAKELVSLNPDLIFSSGGPPTARAAKAATTTIPVVFVSGRAVAEGIVSSLARPGGNLTGLEVLAEDLDARRLALLKDLLPRVVRVAALWNPGTSEAVVQRNVLENAATGLGVKLQFIAVRHPDEIERAFATMARERPDALLVLAEPMFFDAAGRIIGLAAQARLPSVYFVRNFVERGGLNELRHRLPGHLPARRHLRGQDLQGRQTRRSARRAAHHVPVGDQHEDRARARPDDPAVGARTGRRNDRVAEAALSSRTPSTAVPSSAPPAR
ncbi:MAG: ABC transporter substrate-binding protein [Candidatus Rokuibacteriota bacterium]